MKDFIVSVFNSHHGPNCHNRPLAYLRDGDASLYRGCIHPVSAETGTRAKQKAIKEHLESLTCSQKDPYCVRCAIKGMSVDTSTLSAKR